MSGSRPWIAAAGVVILLAPSARGQVAFAPQVGSFPNGVIMSATPAVSFDRRYVRLGMMPQFTVLEGFDTSLVPAAVSGGPGGGLGGAGAGGAVGFAGMNGPISDPGYSSGFPQGGYRPGRQPSTPTPAGFGGSSDFEDQLRPAAAPPRKAAARPAPPAKAKAKRKVATSKAGRTAARAARPR